MKSSTALQPGIQVPAGFLFSAVAAGIKVSGRPDLACAHAPQGASAAALFTSNRVVAAPLEVDRAHLKRSAGRVRFLIVNAGNANCATGRAGRRACEQVCRVAADRIGSPTEQVFPSSTGIIGVPLPVQKILSALPGLMAARAGTVGAVEDFARAIMTTDTRPKVASARGRAGRNEFTLLGVAKGAGMIHPQLATMLVYLFTDVAARPAELRSLLREACDQSFHCISVDGDTSTNDTILLLASGASGLSLGQSRMRVRFAEALHRVCQSLAEQIVADAEGARHVVRLLVEQARDRQEALQVARTIADSALVKTAWAGADPNWGRILAAAGRSGVAINPARVNIFLGEQPVCRNGAAVAFDHEAAHRYLTQPVYDIRIQLGRGRAAVRFLTCDLTAEYVHINADYST